MSGIDVLVSFDSLKKMRLDGTRVFIHKDHRWVLPMVHFAQENGWLPTPTTMVGFDLHHDTSAPTNIEEVRRVRASGTTYGSLIDLCERALSKRDDDWVKAGMEPGLLEDVVIFGVDDRDSENPVQHYTDRSAVEHKIATLGLPKGELESQGALSDLARERALHEVWEILDWSSIHYRRFDFARSAGKLLLDLDLDCFVARWNDYFFPWPAEVCERELGAQISYYSTEGWTGKALTDNFKNRAGLVTIAKEPDFCGGEVKAETVLADIIRYLFDDKFKPEN